MNRPVHVSDRVQAMGHWIFRWRKLDGSPLPGLIAIVIVASLFALASASFRFRMRTLPQTVERHAAVIHLGNGDDGKIWALKAREGGPFPSRFDPAQWEKTAGLEASLIGATRLPSVPYVPALRKLAEKDAIPPVQIIDPNERFFPPRPLKVKPASPPIESRLMPSLVPLSGVAVADIPTDLPAFEGPADAALAYVSWRFLIRLHPDGAVSECIPLTVETGGDALVRWLRGINFGAAAAKKNPWLGIGVEFTNQQIDGTESR